MKTDSIEMQLPLRRQGRVVLAAAVLAASMGLSLSAHADMSTASAGPFTYVCGGVAAVYGAKGMTTTFHNCDFKYSLALQGACTTGNSIKIQ